MCGKPMTVFGERGHSISMPVACEVTGSDRRKEPIADVGALYGQVGSLQAQHDEIGPKRPVGRAQQDREPEGALCEIGKGGVGGSRSAAGGVLIW